MRAIASWSQTYGITEEVTADAEPGEEGDRAPRAGTAAQPLSGVATTQATEHRRRQPIDPGYRPVLRNPVSEHDVEREEPRVGEGEGEADRLRASWTSVSR